MRHPAIVLAGAPGMPALAAQVRQQNPHIMWVNCQAWSSGTFPRTKSDGIFVRGRPCRAAAGLHAAAAEAQVTHHPEVGCILLLALDCWLQKLDTMSWLAIAAVAFEADQADHREGTWMPQCYVIIRGEQACVSCQNRLDVL